MPDLLPNRRSIRLQHYDYSLPGEYYITLCTDRHRCLFGGIHDTQLNHSLLGQIAEEELQRLPERFAHIRLDAYVIMPNHLHAIVQIVTDLHGEQQQMAFQHSVRGSIAAIVRAYKASVTRRVRNRTGERQMTVWQRGYWERVLRNEKELITRRNYILDNPNRWQTDRLYSSNEE